MTKLTPYLLFDGNCANAMTFYQSCLGGELTLTTVGDSPMKFNYPPEYQQKILYANLKSGSIELSAADWLHPVSVPKQGNMVCLFINGGTYDEVKIIFDKLSAGGDKDLLDELKDLFFGSYGALTDKYGVRWMFQGEKKQEK